MVAPKDKLKEDKSQVGYDIIINPTGTKKAQKPAPKPERRPVDERGVVRRGPGGPAKTAPVKQKTRPGFKKRTIPNPEQNKQKQAAALNPLRKTKPVQPRRGGR